MSDDLISRKDLINALFVRNGKMCPDTDIDNFPITINVKDVKKAIRNVPVSYDVDKVVEQLENLRDRFDSEDFHIRGILEKSIEIVKSGGVADD